ncbi:M15 family metallopeptidase, partial [Intestinibacillus massiliensis]|nr:M15 family metallopeptidase [Intestinibacillus massiliensis]
AAVWVAVPGTSEHQLGLAVDLVSLSNQNLNHSQENTALQKWLMKNSWKYGFILRYPSDKSSITGIGYEPWHYRYVGKKAAKAIYEQGVCLEEYLQK